MFRCQFVIYRDSCLPLNPGEYDLYLEFDGLYFSVWSFEIEGDQYKDMTEKLEALKLSDRIVGYRMRERPGAAGQEVRGE